MSANCYECNRVKDVGYEMSDTRESVNFEDSDGEHIGTGQVRIVRNFTECPTCEEHGIPDFGYVADIDVEGHDKLTSPKFANQHLASAFIVAMAPAYEATVAVDHELAFERRCAAQGRPW